MKNIFDTSERLITFLNDLPKNLIAKKECQNNSILFTGAGFLTSYILKEISNNNTFNKIYIIVRNYDKFIYNLKKLNINIDSLPNLYFILKDLKDISIEEFPEVEYVIHNAAEIHAIKNLKQLYSNVTHTNYLAQIYKNQKFIFISSLSVFVSSNIQGCHNPNTLPVNDLYHIYGGYAQSKFLGEKIVEKYILNHKIIRLGLLTGSTNEGHLQKDFLSDFIYNLYHLGMIPDNYENSFVDFTPIDLAAQLILSSFKNKSSIIHIANKESISLNDICNVMNIKKVSNEEFLSKISQFPTTIFYLFYFAFFKTEALKKYPHYFNVDLFQSTNHWYKIQNKFIITNKQLIILYINSIIKEYHV